MPCARALPCFARLARRTRDQLMHQQADYRLTVESLSPVRVCIESSYIMGQLLAQTAPHGGPLQPRTLVTRLLVACLLLLSDVLSAHLPRASDVWRTLSMRSYAPINHCSQIHTRAPRAGVAAAGATASSRALVDHLRGGRPSVGRRGSVVCVRLLPPRAAGGRRAAAHGPWAAARHARGRRAQGDRPRRLHRVRRRWCRARRRRGGEVRAEAPRALRRAVAQPRAQPQHAPGSRAPRRQRSSRVGRRRRCVRPHDVCACPVEGGQERRKDRSTSRVGGPLRWSLACYLRVCGCSLYKNV